MVKAEAGILESDAAAEAERSSPERRRLVPDEDAAWLDRGCGRSSGSSRGGRSA
jgi:hypothetical protein